MRKLMTAIVGVAAGALALAGCSSGTGSAPTETDLDPAALGSVEVQDEMARLYEQAVENGENLVVTYGPNEVIFAPAYEKFTQRYPEIRVQGEFIYGAELTARLDQEFGSGNHVGSMQIGGPALAAATVAAGRCEPWTPIDDAQMQYPMRDSIIGNNESQAVVGFPVGIVYNTENYADSHPTSWLQLSDPEWEDAIVLNDPRMVNGASQTLAQLLHGDYIDENWLEGLKANNPTLAANTGVSLQAVNSGEAAVDGIGFYVYYLEAIRSGEPLGYVFPTDDVAYMQYNYACRLAGGPHPNATELLMNWLFTPEGQAAVSDVGVYGLHEDAPAPQDLPLLAEVQDRLLDPAPIEDTNAVTADAIQRMKQLFG